MTTIYQFPLQSDIAVRLVGSEVRNIPVRYRREIDAIWEKEKKEGFYDGTVLSMIRYSPKEIIGELVSFKAFYASVKNRALRKVLGIYPLGISGRTIFKGKILIGTRGKNVSIYPGEKECVPSGSIDRLFIRSDKTINLECGIATELSEESGINDEEIDRIIPKSLYWDSEGAVFDIHLDIFLNDAAKISALYSPQGEYDDFMWVEKSEVTTSLLETCLPLSRTLLQLPIEK